MALSAAFAPGSKADDAIKRALVEAVEAKGYGPPGSRGPAYALLDPVLSSVSPAGVLYILQHLDATGHHDAAVNALQLHAGRLCEVRLAPVREALLRAGVLPLPEPIDWEGVLVVFEECDGGREEEVIFREQLFRGVDIPSLDGQSSQLDAQGQ